MKAFNKIPIKQNKKAFCLPIYDLKKISNLKVVGSIHKLCFPKDSFQVQVAYKYASSNNRIPYPISGGSNVLIGHLDKIMIVSSYLFKRTLQFTKNDLIISSNYGINYLIQRLHKHGYGGLEFLAGIPAQIGGIVKMNAGAYDKNISDYVKWIVVTDENGEKKLHNDNIEWGYRHTNINGYITKVCLHLEKFKDEEENQKLINNVLQDRKNKHPMDVPSLGCFFKNPPNISAGELIEKAGLKGYSVGHAAVSEKHGNFLVNTGNATFENFIELITHVKKVVNEKFNISLVEEIRIINE